MRFFAFLSMFAVMCGVIATSIEDSAQAPAQLFPKRAADALPIPTLLPQSIKQPLSEPRLLSRGNVPCGAIWQGDNKKNSTHSLVIDMDDDVGTHQDSKCCDRCQDPL
jgi:hypothetical protein